MSDAVLEWVVKGTLYLLGAFSVSTWAVVAIKAIQSSRARRDNRVFAATFGRARGEGAKGAIGLPSATSR